MIILYRIIVVFILFIGVCVNANALPWPIWPDSSWHIVSATYGHIQGMPDGMYVHNAIDIADDAGTPVYAIKAGYVKAVYTIFNSDRHWRIAIADSANDAESDGWLYAHLNKHYISVWVGKYVEVSESLGVIVGGWPDPSTPNHVHLAKIRYSGDATAWADGFYDYEFTGNPLESLDGVVDPDYPYFESAIGDQLFAFYDDIADTLYEEGQPASGYIDIICRAMDHCFNYNFGTAPYMLEYKIEGDSSIPWTTTVIFNEPVGSYNGGWMAMYRSIVYYGDYTNPNVIPELLFYLTNTEGDGSVEVTDSAYCWETPYFHNGEYIVYARATDIVGNSTTDSMTVILANAFELHGTVTHNGVLSGLDGTIITSLQDGVADTTDASGDYSILNVGGGMQHISVHRPGFSSFDTTFLMIETHQLDAVIALQYMCGDSDHSGAVNLLDVTYIIGYLYKSKAAPIPLEAGDANGSMNINLLDVTYLINYLYKGGPAPICPEA
ncbi:MAG: dockerin type I domain-containing protein [Candidatus Zixiibacteriota bacterium]